MRTAVRAYQPADLQAVTDLIQAGFAVQASHVCSFLDGANVQVYDDDGIKGMVALTQPHMTGGMRIARLRLCTHPEVRRSGIGSRLWQAVTPLLVQSGADLVVTMYRVDRGDGARFFSDRGFRPWYGMHEMVYAGPDFPEPQLEAIHYEDRYFADYLRLINDGFAELRQTNDMKPHIIYGPESFADDRLREEMLGNRDNVYVFLEDGELFGLAELEAGADGNAVDTVAVKRSHRGRGLGRAITQFSINRLRERGVGRVYIDVVATNSVARRLYESLGCTLEQSLETARLRLRADAPATALASGERTAQVAERQGTRPANDANGDALSGPTSGRR